MTERIRTLPDAELAVMQAVWACEAPAKRAQISRDSGQDPPDGPDDAADGSVAAGGQGLSAH
ncbi:MAG: hypothetical protein ACLRSV_05115 [Oscillospiraceae bacterium]